MLLVKPIFNMFAGEYKNDAFKKHIQAAALDKKNSGKIKTVII